MIVKFKRNNFVHIESGTYKVQIIYATVKDLKQGRNQLQLILEIINPCDFTGCKFNYCIMMDGGAEHYITRLLEAVLNRRQDGDFFETEDLLYKPIVVTLENSYLQDGKPNYYPIVREVRGRGFA